MRIEEWNKVVEDSFDAAKADIDNGFIKFGDATMRFYVTIKGDKPEDGYPMYIAMHGGGEGDTPDVNDEQWEQMKEYYSDSLECGVYVAVRGVRDTWDTHFNRESYPIYDRLIQDFIIIGIVDPNRVYLEGFSAGGDGVYAIAPRMADRFAAANMSSGHPNNVNFFNMKNLPIQLQVGELDTAFDRHIEGANYEEKLNNLQKTYGGYEHRTLIHFNEGYNYEDMIDFDKEITFNVNGKIVTKKIEPSREKLEETTIERCDPNYQFEAEISYTNLINK